MSNMIYSLRDSLKAYITLHTYGQLWLVPYGYASNTYPPDYQQLVSFIDRQLSINYRLIKFFSLMLPNLEKLLCKKFMEANIQSKILPNCV